MNESFVYLKSLLHRTKHMMPYLSHLAHQYLIFYLLHQFSLSCLSNMTMV